MSKKLLYKKSIKNITELNNFVIRIGNMFKNSILLLDGEIGAGKTTFVKTLAESIGFSGISSPSYNIYNVYELCNGEKFYHFDLYRLKSLEELSDIGFFELIEERALLKAIEWGSILNIHKYLPENFFKITIEIESDIRIISIYG